MTPRIICPYCHSPIDPQTLEAAISARVRYRICPECDRPIVLSAGDEETGEALPVSSVDVSSPVAGAESRVP